MRRCRRSCNRPRRCRRIGRREAACRPLKTAHVGSTSLGNATRPERNRWGSKSPDFPHLAASVFRLHDLPIGRTAGRLLCRRSGGSKGSGERHFRSRLGARRPLRQPDGRGGDGAGDRTGSVLDRLRSDGANEEVGTAVPQRAAAAAPSATLSATERRLAARPDSETVREELRQVLESDGGRAVLGLDAAWTTLGL